LSVHDCRGAGHAQLGDFLHPCANDAH
jgi:hypothetical protein